MASLKLKIIHLLLVFAVIQIACEAAAVKPNAAKAIISKKLKAATPTQRNNYRMMAAKRMQTDLNKAMQAMSTSKKVPADVQNAVKLALQGLQSGKLTQALASSIPNIFQTGSAQQGKPANQLQTILAFIVPKAPMNHRDPLQSMLGFLSSNLRGMNNVLGRAVGGPSDLLMGTVNSLSDTLGAVNRSMNDSVGSLGSLMGGLLAG